MPLSRAERDIGLIRVQRPRTPHTVGRDAFYGRHGRFIVIQHGRILDGAVRGATIDERAHPPVRVQVADVGAGRRARRSRTHGPRCGVTRTCRDARRLVRGCSVQDLLDMRAGTRFSESTTISLPISGSASRSRLAATHARALPADLYAYMAGLEQPGAARRAVRVPLDPDRRARLGARARRRRLVRQLVLAPRLEPDGRRARRRDHRRRRRARRSPTAGYACRCALLRGSGCCTSRGGVDQRRRVLPEGWTARVGKPRPGLVAPSASLTYEARDPHLPTTHDQWWVFDAEREIYGGIGIHGQALVIHRPADRRRSPRSRPTPSALDRDKHELQLAGAVAIGDAWPRG